MDLVEGRDGIPFLRKRVEAQLAVARRGIRASSGALVGVEDGERLERRDTVQRHGGWRGEAIPNTVRRVKTGRSGGGRGRRGRNEMMSGTESSGCHDQPSFDRVCLPGTDFDDTLEVERGEVCQWRARVGPRPCPGSLSGVEGAIVCLPRLIRRERARRVGRGGDSSNLTHPRESSMRDKRQRVNLDRREKKEARKQEISREQSRVAGGYPRRLPSFSKRGWSCAAWATPPGLLTRRRRVFLSRAELTTRMARRIA